MKNFKKLFLILVVFSFTVLLFSSVALAQDVEEIYPQVPGAEAPTTIKAFLPGYIQYVFNFAIIIAGIIAFASIVYAGFRYLASAGNPTTMSDARSQITAGILGLLILVTSYLILIQINPELIVLKIGKIEFEKGVILYADSGCPGGDTPLDGTEEGKDFLRVRANYAWLGNDFSNTANSMYVYNSSDELDVKIFSNIDYENLFWKTAENEPYPGDRCFSIAQDSESIQLTWKFPGVYLFTDAACKEEPHLFISSISDFAGIGLHDKAKSIKIIPRIKIGCGFGLSGFETCTGAGTFDDLAKCADLEANPECKRTIVSDKFGVVLHEHSEFDGDAEVFFGGNIDSDPSLQLRWCYELGATERSCTNTVGDSFCQKSVGGRASAITIFDQRPPGSPLPTGGVTLFSNYEFNDQDDEGEPDIECGPYPDQLDPTRPQWITRSDCPIGVSSIKIEGDYIAVLFRGDGKGEVFRESDLRLKGNRIDDDKVEYMLVIPVVKGSI